MNGIEVSRKMNSKEKARLILLGVAHCKDHLYYRKVLTAQ